ncbi:hypothetical protein HOS22_gp52 [Rhizobium phage RHEph08]|uniref:Uncharacterized protein n=1 Tax=Rhizobium phage RHEph08 TaxID=1220715 RepID=L7TS26_9CAUD|nr:hypothetical protein HOS22_gp52 [Rhizobium phage RHEph08]AGC35976.1 hypothetical protein RHEph08_gp052 [Rhizobium phage RHEph08]
MAIVWVRFKDSKVVSLSEIDMGPEWMAVDDQRPDVQKYIKDPMGLEDTFKDLNPVRFKLGVLYLNVTPEMVHDAIYALPEPDKTIAAIYWESTLVFKRDDPLLAQISAGFGLTEQQVNEAWKYAEQLT